MASGSNSRAGKSKPGYTGDFALLPELWQTKGVMLSHGNLLHQITTFGAVFGAVQPPGDRFLSILPAGTPTNARVNIHTIPGCTQISTSASQAGLAGI